jgi:Na+-transporting NADH:ubiquinone oxidoreductase subunit NqrB
MGTTPSWTSSGDDQTDAYFGISVASAGDVNGDGYDDVIVGAHLYDAPNPNAGKAYLYLGSSFGLETIALWTSSGDAQAYAHFGSSVASAGDVNGDGYDDVVIGSQLHDTPNANAGKAYLYLGSSLGLQTSPAWTSSGDDQEQAYFGVSAAGAGDVNGDGYDDVVISASHYDSANPDVVSISWKFFWTRNITSMDKQRG